MTDGPSGLGPKIGGASALAELRRMVGLDTTPGGRASAPAAGAFTGGDPHGLGPRGQRILPAGTPLELLDRSAPRGTYVDILV